MIRKIKEFDKKSFEDLGYYVYCLINTSDDKTIFVGYGKENDCFDHLNLNENFINKIKQAEEKENNYDESFYQIGKIKELKKEKKNIEIIIHRFGLKKRSIAIEIANTARSLLILDKKLQDVTDELSFTVSPEKIQQLILFKQTAPFARKSNKRIIFLNIPRSYFAGINIQTASEKAWHLKFSRAKRAEYVIPHVFGKILGVFQVRNCTVSTNYKSRVEFSLIDISQTTGRTYLGCQLPQNIRYKKGAQNPCRYTYK